MYSSEVWKDIDERYQVSNFGNIRSKCYGYWRLLKLHPVRHGYLKVVLVKNRVSASYYVHRLVAEAFVENPENKPQVNHKNGVKTDNRADNLEWVSIKENVRHAFETGLTNHYVKYKKIKCLETDEFFNSLCDVQRKTGINACKVWYGIKKKRPVNGYNFVVVD